MVVDKSPAKQGQIFNGYTVRAPEEINGNVEIVIVTPRYIYENVRRELSEQDMEVIDINQYLGIY